MENIYLGASFDDLKTNDYGIEGLACFCLIQLCGGEACGFY